jgi:regulator of RNase E activity RraA
MTLQTKIKLRKRSPSRFSHLIEKAKAADIPAIGHHLEFGFVDPGIRLLSPRNAKIAGIALTVRIPANESKAMHLAASMVCPGEIIVVDRCLDRTHACLGEMVALGARLRGAEGIIVDGPVTDFSALREINLPVFGRGLSALTTKFVFDVGEIGEDISCGSVVVHDGDLVLADENGILVLSDPEEAEALLDAALVDGDDETIDKGRLEDGMTLQQLYVQDYTLSNGM